MTPTDGRFLESVADTLVNVYEHSPTDDIVLALRDIAKRLHKIDNDVEATEFTEGFGEIVATQIAEKVIVNTAPEWSWVDPHLLSASPHVYTSGNHLWVGSILYEITGWSTEKSCLVVQRLTPPPSTQPAEATTSSSG